MAMVKIWLAACSQYAACSFQHCAASRPADAFRSTRALLGLLYSLNKRPVSQSFSGRLHPQVHTARVSCMLESDNRLMA